MSTPAGWYPDPNGQYDHRYWDGAQWTDDVSAGGRAGKAPVAPAPAQTQVRTTATPQKVQRQVAKAAGAQPAKAARTKAAPATQTPAKPARRRAAGAGGGTLFDEPVLVVNQKAKFVELTNEYAVFDANGNQLGSVVQVGQSAARKVLRFVSNVDQFLKHRLEVRDANGAAVLSLTRPAKVFKSTVIVTRPDGSEVGRIVQDNVFGKIHFALMAGEYKYGSINAENWRAWNFNIRDHADTEVARITKTFGGLLKAAFTTADNYVVQIHRPLEEPLRSLVIAAALTVDTALKQDE